MKEINNFVAIDFETANQNRSSICSVGVVIFCNGEIDDKYYSLVRPEPNYYTLSRIHGLDRSDTDSARLFPEVWAELAPKIAGLPLFAHNSAFDESCLRAAFELYNMTYPDYEFHCTYRGAQNFFNNHAECTTPPSFGLDALCEYFGIKFDHHNALSDAYACAMLSTKI